MRIALCPVAVLLLAAALAPAARAQGPGGYYRPPPYTNRAAAPLLVFDGRTDIGVQTSVAVPDGGTALVGGYSRLSEGRGEYGVPGVGKVPYAGRGLRNVGYGRQAVSGRVTAGVRVIDLREEEFRQTGFRSP